MTFFPSGGPRRGGWSGLESEPRPPRRSRRGCCSSRVDTRETGLVSAGGGEAFEPTPASRDEHRRDEHLGCHEQVSRGEAGYRVEPRTTRGRAPGVEHCSQAYPRRATPCEQVSPRTRHTDRVDPGTAAPGTVGVDLVVSGGYGPPSGRIPARQQGRSGGPRCAPDAHTDRRGARAAVAGRPWRARPRRGTWRGGRSTR